MKYTMFYKTKNLMLLWEKKGLVYLLIEKDTSKPWSYQGWLETVIRGGDIVSTEQLKNGFIIQKRLFNE